MNAIILAGGKASRMSGRDKAFLKIGRDILIHRQLRALEKIFKKIIIVTNAPQKYDGLKGAEIISDIVVGRGPLGGIYSGLAASAEFYNFVIACDMPFINESSIRHMIENREDHDVVVLKIDEKFHPLFGVYSKNCVPAIEALIEQGELRVSSLFPKVKSRFLSKQEIQGFDENLYSLTNINTKEDLIRAEEIKDTLAF